MLEICFGTIAKSNSEKELETNLCQFYDSIRGNDATNAFTSFGFADFAAMKKALKERTDKILSISKKKAEMDSALEAINLSEEEAKSYVTTRTGDRYGNIISAVIVAIDHKIDDIAIPEEIRRTINELS